MWVGRVLQLEERPPEALPGQFVWTHFIDHREPGCFGLQDRSFRLLHSFRQKVETTDTFPFRFPLDSDEREVPLRYAGCIRYNLETAPHQNEPG